MRTLARHFITAYVAMNVSSLEYQLEFFLFLTLVIISSASLMGCLAFLLLGKALLVALNVFTFLLGIIGLAGWYRTKNIRVPVNIVVIGLMCLNVFAMMLTGGLYSVLVFNFAIPLVIALIYYGPKRMLQIFVFLALIVIAFMVLEMSGNIPVPAFVLTSNELIYGGITLTLLFGIFGALYISDAIRQESYRELQQERDTVQMRIEEATRHLEEQQENITIINYHLELRNQELQAAIKVSEAAKNLQSDFLRNISHEVRTPLAVIMGFGEILLEQIEKENSSAHESVKHIEVAGKNLLDIFNNILTLSTFEHSGITLSPVRVHIANFAQQMFEEFIEKAEAKGLTLKLEGNFSSDEWMDFDMMYLRQILHHLLSNAMKFTESGTVVLSFEVLSDKDLYVHDVVRWTVRDTGIGIAPEFREKLFAPFHQHDAGQTRLYGGLGLGLAITKYLVDAMNGRVWCESELGKGATFIVELPKSA
jgi:signal transduction histidine kinase